MRYYDLIKDMAIKFNLRLNIVKLAKETSVSHAAREYQTTRKTVRKWLLRYDKEGLKGLEDQPKTPHHIPHKMPKEKEDRVISLRKDLHTFGPRRLKDRFDLDYSHQAIGRVIKQNGLTQGKRKRWRKRQDLSEMKKRLKFFQKSQVDTKDLSDIRQYWPLMKRLGLPRYEYALRELSTGASFFAYSDENNLTNASRFCDYVVQQLKRYGVKTANITCQTDNGSEYIGNVNKKTNRLSLFEKTLKYYEITHGRIPPRSSYLQGDVETFNRIVEDEFFEVESFRDEEEFLGKTYAYQLFFNYLRKNRYRDNKSPVDILRERFPEVDTNVLNLPPIRLDHQDDRWMIDDKPWSGYHVPRLAP